MKDEILNRNHRLYPSEPLLPDSDPGRRESCIELEDPVFSNVPDKSEIYLEKGESAKPKRILVIEILRIFVLFLLIPVLIITGILVFNKKEQKSIFTPMADKQPDEYQTGTIQISGKIPLSEADTVKKTGKDGARMVYIPGGTFPMGADDTTAGENERPVHTVYIDSFWIDETEVTNFQYKLCVDTGSCLPPEKSSSATRVNYYGNPDFDAFPVVFINWDQADIYCKWAEERLPTEAEWEKAARGTNLTRFWPWGNIPPDQERINFNRNIGDTVAAGSYPSNVSPYGILDMAGNVQEWVFDWYNETYYENSPTSNPSGPMSGEQKITRGGSWSNFDIHNRVSSRSPVLKNKETDSIGFRCAGD